MKKLISLILSRSLGCTGLPRHFVPRNDEVHNRHCKGVSPWQSSTIRHKGNIKPKGFSLIELLISLMIISVVTAAFAPVLTHKLKNHGVAISQKGLSFDKCTEIDENCEICIGNTCYGCSRTCAINEYKDVGKCKCVSCNSKYDSNCIKCNADECKKCNGGFAPTSSGCTSCDIGSASDGTEACKQCDYNYYQPSSSQSSCLPCGGGKYTDTKGATSCKNCSDAYGAGCTSCTKDSCTYCKAGYGYNSTTKKCESCGANQYSTGGLSGCSTCGSGTTVNAAKNGCDAIVVTPPPAPEAPTCSAGQYLAGGTTCVNCAAEGSYTDSDNQKSSCDTCGAGKIHNSTHTGCVDCPYGCKSCTGDICTSCYSCFNLSGGKCEIKGKCPTYSMVVAYQDTCFCMKTRNAGDTNGPSIPTTANASKGVVKVNKGKSVDFLSAPACWQLSNANSSYDDATGLGFNYKTTTRTTCTWDAAESICNNIGWSLPTLEQLKALKGIIDTETSTNSIIQRWKGKNGLQMCSGNSNFTPTQSGSPTCVDIGGKNWSGCDVGGQSINNHACKVSSIWGEKEGMNGTLSSSMFMLSNSSSVTYHYARSVRCVKAVE